MDPATKGIVDRNLVKQHQRTAGRGRSEAAQRNPFRGGIGYQRTGTAKKFEPGNLPQLVIERNPRRLAQLLGSKKSGAGGAITRSQGGPVGSDRHTLQRMFQQHMHGRGAVQVDRRWLEVGSCDLHPA